MFRGGSPDHLAIPEESFFHRTTIKWLHHDQARGLIDGAGRCTVEDYFQARHRSRGKPYLLHEDYGVTLFPMIQERSA